MSGLCRDCFSSVAATDGRCGNCHSPRVLKHPELKTLKIAHIDCDAFYASIEKRDDPTLKDKPVIVGGGKRGVVSTACYIARLHGVRSAMPMYMALKACPAAVVIRPNMAKYAEVGRQIRALMLQVTPQVEPLSLDEAFLDLTGTERLHGCSAAETLMRLIKAIEEQAGITASVGLSYNKFLAKLSSDLDKPRGFSVLGKEEAKSFLANRPVGSIWGVGKVLQNKLTADGITMIGQLQGLGESFLIARYGTIGRRLASFALGEDSRTVTPSGKAKNISAETTLESDIADYAALEKAIWQLCEKLSWRLKSAGLAARTYTLKLKTGKFKLITRARSLETPTQMAEAIFQAVVPLLAGQVDGTAYRLLGVGATGFSAADDADHADLLDLTTARQVDLERAMDKVRQRFGRSAIIKGRSF